MALVPALTLKISLCKIALLDLSPIRFCGATPVSPTFHQPTAMSAHMSSYVDRMYVVLVRPPLASGIRGHRAHSGPVFFFPPPPPPPQMYQKSSSLFLLRILFIGKGERRVGGGRLLRIEDGGDVIHYLPFRSRGSGL